jgi:serine/threonine protein phosphatase PrpC
MAQPVEITPDMEGAIPMAVPVELEPGVEVPMAVPLESPDLSDTAPYVPATPVICPVCQSPRRGEDESCHDCGYFFTAADLNPGGSTPDSAVPATPTLPGRLQDRYEAQERLSERTGVVRYRGLDHGVTPPARVLIVQQAQPRAPVPVETSEDEILPSFDADLSMPLDLPPEEAPGSGTDTVRGVTAPWPSVEWERNFLNALEHPTLPAKLDEFSQDGFDYLILEAPQGTVLWDAWDDLDATWETKFTHLVHIAETLAHLHTKRVILEALRPDLWVIDERGQVRLTDISELVPLPLAPDAPIRAKLYTAPEVVTLSPRTDARADLYGFGAMLYALHVGREPTERDFMKQGEPKPFVPQFPDIHPAFGRLMARTFRKDPAARFPTDEGGKTDPTGFQELIHQLKALARTFDTVRLEIASWTTTGMIRTNNEDGFALLHATEARQDDLGEQALVFLCDGMGGYEAGEVAAALAIQLLRTELLQHGPFGAVAGKSPFPIDPLAPVPEQGYAPPPLDLEKVQALIKAALKAATRQIYTTAKAPGSKRGGMGCTAEVVFTDGRHLVVGHVGDSRTYHLREGRLIQLTRDQTYVNRMVELGQLSEAEAENHPRRNELQQALGGRPDVEPGMYTSILHPGDWILVCSDGVTNHVKPKDLQEMLQSEATSAEMAARRLVNLTNIEGATDNATVVVIRCT